MSCLSDTRPRVLTDTMTPRTQSLVNATSALQAVAVHSRRRVTAPCLQAAGSRHGWPGGEVTPAPRQLATRGHRDAVLGRLTRAHLLAKEALDGRDKLVGLRQDAQVTAPIDV